MRQMLQKKTRTDYPRVSYAQPAWILTVMTPKRIERFWSKVHASGGLLVCHPWRGGRNAGGYGLFQGSDEYQGFSFLAHRVAWALRNEREPGREWIIRHTCDNPPCCNPRHLLIGDHADNTYDMCSRGRLVVSSGQGADANAADFSWEDRARAHDLRYVHRMPIADIALAIGCHRSTIMRWLNAHETDS